jgi:septal ring factor EnvC (AmiA/AmiB activator)
MNIIGKIFVFAVFIMSLVFMSFGVAIYSTHTNWREEITKTGGLNDQLKAAQDEVAEKQQRITELTQQVSESEVARDNVIAQIQATLREKNQLLMDLRKKVDEQEQARGKAQDELALKSRELEEATDEINGLRESIRNQQQSLDDQVKRTADMAVELHEKESQLVIIRERRSQLEKQVANARILLQQMGLNVNSPAEMPDVDGVVIAVGREAIELSLGGDDGLQQGHELEVFRDDTYLGRIRVVTVRPDKAVATVIPEFKRGFIQRGDRVASRLKG